MILKIDGVNAIEAETFDDSNLDVIGISWTGRITGDSVFRVELRTAKDTEDTIIENSAWISYELFPSEYPLDDEFPHPC